MIRFQHSLLGAALMTLGGLVFLVVVPALRNPVPGGREYFWALVTILPFCLGFALVVDAALDDLGLRTAPFSGTPSSRLATETGGVRESPEIGLS